jgi:phospholipase/carboxylesterase
VDKPKLSTNVEPLWWVGVEEPAFAYSGLIHYVHIPREASSTQPAPAAVMIHGWGGDETVMWIFKQTLPPGLAIITPRAPFELDEGGFVWFYEKGERSEPDPHSLETTLSKLQQFLGSLPALYPIDPARLVLMGFSQGAAIINALALTHPQAVSGAVGVVLMAGALPHVSEPATTSPVLADLPVFIAHGIEDQIIPLSAAHQVRDRYIELSADVTYKEYPTGHKMNSRGMQDLRAWLAERFRKEPGR